MQFLCLFPSSAALAEITEMVAQLHGTMIKMENFQKLHELKKDLIGVDNLVIPGRVSSLCMLWKWSQKDLCVLSHFQFSSVQQLRLTLCNPMDYSPPGSSVPGTLQARILEWVATSSSRASSRPRDQTRVS